MSGLVQQARILRLQQEGIAYFPGVSSFDVDLIWASLRHLPRYAGHVKREGRPCTGMPISCWDMHDVMLAPMLWPWALSTADLAAEYLGGSPLLYSINVFESCPSDISLHPGIEVFHRDYDDTRFLACFLYLTDTGRDDGSHLYQCGTHTGDEMTHLAEIFGPRGTSFVADTRGLHCSVRPQTQPRRLAWARWGVSDPPESYVRDQLRPIAKEQLGDRYPTDPEMQQRIRLVAA